jgi:hypothetical protein
VTSKVLSGGLDDGCDWVTVRLCDWATVRLGDCAIVRLVHGIPRGRACIRPITIAYQHTRL